MSFDVAQIDELLATTRAVRRRLDLERFDDGPGLIAETDIDAAPSTVWALVTDLDLPARFSDGFLGAEWDGDDRGVGAFFHGRNQHKAVGEWSIPLIVDGYDNPRAFGWRTSDPDDPGARWRFELEARDGGVGLRFSYVIGPGLWGTSLAIVNPGKEHRVLRRRLDEVYANMQGTVAGVKQIAEGAP